MCLDTRLSVDATTWLRMAQHSIAAFELNDRSIRYNKHNQRGAAVALIEDSSSSIVDSSRLAPLPFPS